MMIFKKITAISLLTCLFFVASLLTAGKALAAPKLYFEPSTLNSTKDYDFQIYLQIDVENSSAFGADATVTFPSSDITVKSVTNGGFFSNLNYAQSSGKLEIHGFFSAPGNSKSGQGTLATLTLNSNKDSGSGILDFACSSNGNDTEILDANGNNVLSCNSLNKSTIAFTTNGYAPPNSCGGTCGSNYNCSAPLFCFNGYCRNTNCPGDLTCGCAATPTPKPTVTKNPASKPSPTSEVIYLSPRPISSPSAAPLSTTPSPTASGSSSQQHGGFGYLLWIAAAAFALAIILLIFFL